jgi:hypothetical protein
VLVLIGSVYTAERDDGTALLNDLELVALPLDPETEEPEIIPLEREEPPTGVPATEREEVGLVNAKSLLLVFGIYCRELELLEL